jgi:hypothetical protein
MRASNIALIAAVLTIPSAVDSQDNGLVDGRVGSDLSTSSTQPSPSNGLQGAYRRPGPRAGSSGIVMPGQVVPEAVPVFTRQDGSATAFVAGRRVIVGPNSNRILRVVH